jgi:lactate dehydrogenase-like 2-hydroxyacid dehydrogenase
VNAPPGLSPVDLPTLLRESDIVSLHAGLNAQNHHMIAAGELALMHQPRTS